MERILLPCLKTIGTRICDPREEVTAEDEAGIYKGRRIYHFSRPSELGSTDPYPIDDKDHVRDNSSI